MFARHVAMHVKPVLANEFPVAFDKEILLLLQKQGDSSRSSCS